MAFSGADGSQRASRGCAGGRGAGEWPVEAHIAAGSGALTGSGLRIAGYARWCEKGNSYRCEHVLSGVLLHVVPAAGPVELESNRPLDRRVGKIVTDFLSCLPYIEHPRFSERTVIGRLAAPFGVEDGVGDDGERPSILFADVDHLGREFGQKTIAVIGSFGHSTTRYSSIA